MAAITPTVTSSPKPGGSIVRYSGTGTANQADSLTSTAVPVGGSQRLLYVTVTYSAAPTQTGVDVTLDSGLGAAFDAVLLDGSDSGIADKRYTVFIPDGDLWLSKGDAIKVDAPAAGGVITASIVIALEVQ